MLKLKYRFLFGHKIEAVKSRREMLRKCLRVSAEFFAIILGWGRRRLIYVRNTRRNINPILRPLSEYTPGKNVAVFCINSDDKDAVKLINKRFVTAARN